MLFLGSSFFQPWMRSLIQLTEFYILSSHLFPILFLGHIWWLSNIHLIKYEVKVIKCLQILDWHCSLTGDRLVIWFAALICPLVQGAVFLNFKEKVRFQNLQSIFYMCIHLKKVHHFTQTLINKHQKNIWGRDRTASPGVFECFFGLLYPVTIWISSLQSAFTKSSSMESE